MDSLKIVRMKIRYGRVEYYYLVGYHNMYDVVF